MVGKAALYIKHFQVSHFWHVMLQLQFVWYHTHLSTIFIDMLHDTWYCKGKLEPKGEGASLLGPKSPPRFLQLVNLISGLTKAVDQLR